MDEFRAYRRRLPHWRADDSIYFVTWCLERGLPDLDCAERDQFLAALRHFRNVRYILYSAVVMNDHVHALVEPIPPFSLEEIVRSWKVFTSRHFSKRTGRVWQSEYYDRIMRNEHEFAQKLGYIVANPYLRWPGIQSYPWIWIDAAVYD